MSALPAYSIIPAGTYELNRSEMMGRVRIPGETPEQAAARPFFGLGDAEAAAMNVTTTKLSRFRKNARVRTKALEIVTQTESSLSFTFMQRTKFLAGLSAMGALKPVTQVAVSEAATFTIAKINVGDRYFVGKHDISDVTFPEGYVAGQHYAVADEALGIVDILALPEGVAADSAASFTYKAAASTAGLHEAAMGTQVEVTLELLIRELSEHAKPRFYHLYECPLSMDGDVLLQGGDDFTQWTVTGSALDQGGGKGIGLMRELSI